MLLSIVFIIFIALVAYWYSLQGLLSGFISAVLSVFAAAVAFSFFEPVADYLSGGKFNDQAHAICLVALFALTYLVLRIIFDKVIPGNIRVAAIADKAGGAAFGAFSAVIALGLMAVALQSMPMDASIGGYSRFPLSPDRPVTVPPIEGTSNRAVDRVVYAPMKADTLDSDQSGLLLPIDDWVLGIMSHLSDTGALATGKPFKSVHPDLLQEYFGQRVGVEPGAKHTAKREHVTLQDPVYVLPQKPQPPLARRGAEFEQVSGADIKGNLTVEPGKDLIAVTVLFNQDAADELEADRLVRLSTSAVRLAAKDPDGNWKNYFPLGTLQGGVAWIHRPDDPMFVNVKEKNRGAMFLFQVDEAVVRQGKEFKFQSGAFLEVKRLAKFPLEDVKVVASATVPRTPPEAIPVRKVFKGDKKPTPETPETAAGETKPTPTPEAPKPETPETPKPETPKPETPKPETPEKPAAEDNGWKDAPLEKPVFKVSSALPFGVTVDAPDAESLASPGAAGSIKAKKFENIEFFPEDPGAAVRELSKGPILVKDVAAPADQRVLQVTLTVKKTASDPWVWADNLGDYGVLDSAGTVQKPRGAIALFGGKAAGKYDQGSDVASVTKGKGPVTSVTLFFLVPQAAKAKELQYQGKAGGLPLEK